MLSHGRSLERYVKYLVSRVTILQIVTYILCKVCVRVSLVLQFFSLISNILFLSLSLSFFSLSIFPASLYLSFHFFIPHPLSFPTDGSVWRKAERIQA